MKNVFLTPVYRKIVFAFFAENTIQHFVFKNLSNFIQYEIF